MKKNEDRALRGALRGGSWYGESTDCRASDRYWDALLDRGSNLGFRVLRRRRL